MRIRYIFQPLSKAERELHEAVLMDELNIQSWYAVACSNLLRGEIIVPIQ